MERISGGGRAGLLPVECRPREGPRDLGGEAGPHRSYRHRPGHWDLGQGCGHRCRLGLHPGENSSLRLEHHGLTRINWVPDHLDLTFNEDPLTFRWALRVWPPGTADAANVLDDLGLPHDVSGNAAFRALKAVGKGRNRAVVLAAWRSGKSGGEPRTPVPPPVPPAPTQLDTTPGTSCSESGLTLARYRLQYHLEPPHRAFRYRWGTPKGYHRSEPPAGAAPQAQGHLITNHLPRRTRDHHRHTESTLDLLDMDRTAASSSMSFVPTASTSSSPGCSGSSASSDGHVRNDPASSAFLRLHRVRALDPTGLSAPLQGRGGVRGASTPRRRLRPPCGHVGAAGGPVADAPMPSAEAAQWNWSGEVPEVPHRRSGAARPAGCAPTAERPRRPGCCATTGNRSTRSKRWRRLHHRYGAAEISTRKRAAWTRGTCRG